MVNVREYIPYGSSLAAKPITKGYAASLIRLGEGGQLEAVKGS